LRHRDRRVGFRDARDRKLDPAGERAIVSRLWRPAAGADLGYLLNSASPWLGQAPWLAIAPRLCIFGTVLATNFVGDGLCDALERRA
jgi:hypothetical protein